MHDVSEQSLVYQELPPAEKLSVMLAEAESIQEQDKTFEQLEDALEKTQVKTFHTSYSIPRL